MADDDIVPRPVRMPASMWAAVDEAAGPRGAGKFIRAAVEAALAGRTFEPTVQAYARDISEPAPVSRPKAVAKPDGLSARGKVVLSVVTERRSVTLNEVVRHLGWAPRGVDQAAEELRKAGLVRLDGFVLELVG